MVEDKGKCKGTKILAMYRVYVVQFEPERQDKYSLSVELAELQFPAAERMNIGVV